MFVVALNIGTVYFYYMKFIEGKNRDQLVLIPTSLDALIDAENEVRTIDLFVDSLDVKDFGFVVKESVEGRPAYHPKVLLKLFIYGYLNRIRSSRALEKECSRNIELMWLLKQLTPDLPIAIGNYFQFQKRQCRRHSKSLSVYCKYCQIFQPYWRQTHCR
jgi:transposase